MLKSVSILIFFVATGFSNELVDALKGKKSVNVVSIDRVEKRQCDAEIAEAIEKNNLQFFKSSKGQLKELNNCVISDDPTPLMAAAYTDRPSIVKLFLNDGVNPDETNKKGYTALHFAAFYGNYEVVKALIAAGANINAQNNARQTPLMIAAYYGNAKTAEILLANGADMELVDKSGMSAYELAAKKDKKEVLRLFKKAKR